MDDDAERDSRNADSSLSLADELSRRLVKDVVRSEICRLESIYGGHVYYPVQAPTSSNIIMDGNGELASAQQMRLLCEVRQFYSLSVPTRYFIC